MTVREAVQQLCDAGWSTYQIAREIERLGVECNQSNVARIKTGEIRDPRYSLGAALIELARKRRKAA